MNSVRLRSATGTRVQPEESRRPDSVPPPIIAPELAHQARGSVWEPLRYWAHAYSGRQGFVLTRWLFLRLLGLIYLCAFASLWGQLRALIGSHGLLPAVDYLRAVEAATGPARFWALPTLAWLNASDAFIQLLCGAGIVLALLLIVGLLPIPALALLWLAYLSLVNIGQDFLSFQWDALLLETGFLAMFWAPNGVFPRLKHEAPPSLGAVWLLRWLLFRLMFFSGVVKLASGDPAWRDLTALSYHYQTQPLPTPLAWYLYQLPLSFHKLSTALTLAVELIVPFAIFAPRRLRLLGAAVLISLQVLIMASGNYAFFNLLAIVLCLTLFDDAALRHILPHRLAPAATGTRTTAEMHDQRRLVAALAVTVLTISRAADIAPTQSVQSAPMIRSQRPHHPQPVDALAAGRGQLPPVRAVCARSSMAMPHTWPISRRARTAQVAALSVHPLPIRWQSCVRFSVLKLPGKSSPPMA